MARRACRLRPRRRAGHRGLGGDAHDGARGVDEVSPRHSSQVAGGHAPVGLDATERVGWLAEDELEEPDLFGLAADRLELLERP